MTLSFDFIICINLLKRVHGKVSMEHFYENKSSGLLSILSLTMDFSVALLSASGAIQEVIGHRT